MKKTIFFCFCLLAFFSVVANADPLSIECEDDTVTTGPLPHPTDCKKFYFCVVLDSPSTVRIALDSKCPAGLYFAPDERTCVYTMEEAKNPAPPCNYVPSPL
ncbi:carbohydrate-binding module family 14 protein [Pedobacter frigoris]|uniref:carbohydrate-binding module family 14 protein n=1 Tax=Pedobacter frigoris TaxID=2571272 RepID=UPI00292EA11A|nr:carbohydrate-binding module family 14 protein [Pedobacter frigoris]